VTFSPAVHPVRFTFWNSADRSREPSGQLPATVAGNSSFIQKELLCTPPGVTDSYCKG